MAGIIGYETTEIDFEIVTFASEELNEYTEVEYNPTVYEFKDTSQLVGSYSDWREHTSNRWQIKGELLPSFFQDYYFRIHCNPLEINFGTISTDQQREFYIWNAYPYNQVNLYEIIISDSTGITITGQSFPYALKPLQELTYELYVDGLGSPRLNSQIQFDFSDYPDPLPLILTGERIIKFDVIPEVPIKETWEWLTDVIVSEDGTEQRIDLRGEYPKIEQSFNAVFDSEQSLREFYSNLLISKSALWVPEFQYATKLTSPSIIGNTSLYFDNSKIDIRAGEFVLIKSDEVSEVIEILTIESYGATTNTLTFDIPSGSYIISGSSAYIEDNSYLERYAPNGVGKTKLTCKFLRERDTLYKTSVSFDTFLSDIVLPDRSLVKETSKDSFSSGIKSLDNSTGLIENISRWDYSRVTRDVYFKFDRYLNYDKLNYWKYFFSLCRGQARKFWMPTFRNDLELFESAPEGTSSITCKGLDYARKVYQLPTHRYLEIETEAGIHRVSVVGASEVDGKSLIAFSPALPPGSLWANINRISFLLPMRLATDEVKLTHYHLDTTIEFSVRTAEV